VVAAAAAAEEERWHSDRGKNVHSVGPARKCTFLARVVGWRQDNGNRSNQESKFDFLAT